MAKPLSPEKQPRRERGVWVPARPELELTPRQLVRPLLWALPGVGILAGVSYFAWDDDVASWVHHAPRWLRQTADAITQTGSSVPTITYAILATIVLALFRRWSLVSNALVLLYALIMTGAINFSLKFTLGRARPSTNVVREGGVDVWSEGPRGFFLFETGYKYMGFPSGHSATAGAIAAVGVMLLPKLWPVWLAYAVVIPATRVLTNAHYVADTVVGIWVGAMSACLSTWLCLRFIAWREAVAQRARLDDAAP